LAPRTWTLPYAFNILEILLLGSIVVTLSLVEENLTTVRWLWPFISSYRVTSYLQLEEWDKTLGLINEAAVAVAAARAREAELRQQVTLT
jgi:hypothetical protein